MSVTCREHVGVRRGSLTWTIAARKPDEMVAWDRIGTCSLVEAATRKSFGSYTEFTITTSISSMYLIQASNATCMRAQKNPLKRD